MSDNSTQCCQSRTGDHPPNYVIPPSPSESPDDDCANCCKFKYFDFGENIRSNDRNYFRSTANSQIYPVKYYMDIYINSRKEVHIIVRLKKDDILNEVKDTIDSKINALAPACHEKWSRKFVIRIVKSHCKTVDVKVNFYLKLVNDGDYDYKLNVYKGDNKNVHRAGVNGINVDLYYKASFDEETITHEYGHMIGLPDEYLSGNIYYKIPPENKEDAPLAIPVGPVKMGSQMTDKIERRYYYCIAIELQRLLRKKYNDSEIKCYVV